MSKFTEIPYIELVLGEVSSENKALLLKYINGKDGSNNALTYTLKTLSELNALNTGVYAVIVPYNSKIQWKGYFIKTSNYEVFLTFKTGIDLTNVSVYKTDTADFVPAGEVGSDYIRGLLREDSYIDPVEMAAGNGNLANGSGTNAVRQKMADNTVNFTGRNPNAETLDPTLSAIINTGASGGQSSAFGKNTAALATASFANGNKTIAKGEESHAEGYQSVTLGDGSHAEGEQTTSDASVSHSEGSNTVSGGVASHAEGVRSKTKAYNGIQDSGVGSHAEGESTEASGYCSHTEGFGSYTGGINNAPNYPDIPDEPGSGGGGGEPVPQVGNIAHAEGNYCFAVGTGSHAEGYHTKALHEASHAEGVGTKTSTAGQHVSGYYNEDNPAALFIVGNGSADDARSNAFEVLANGSVKVNGQALSSGSQVYIHNLSIEDNDDNYYCFEIINNSQEPINSLAKLCAAMKYTNHWGNTKYRIYMGYLNSTRCFISKNSDNNYLAMSTTSISALADQKPLTAFHDNVIEL